MSNLKVTCVEAEGVRLIEGGRQPDVVVNVRLLSKKHSSSLSQIPTCTEKSLFLNSLARTLSLAAKEAHAHEPTR